MGIDARPGSKSNTTETDITGTDQNKGVRQIQPESRSRNKILPKVTPEGRRRAWWKRFGYGIVSLWPIHLMSIAV